MESILRNICPLIGIRKCFHQNIFGVKMVTAIDGAFDYCCALGVQHTSPKSGGELVTLIVSYCDDGASRLL